MSALLHKGLNLGSTSVVLSLLIMPGAIAVESPASQPLVQELSATQSSHPQQTQFNQLSQPRVSSRKVPSVAELSDVQPTDWAYQALQSLIERYGVVTGYADGQFRGNQALTRNEFAVALAIVSAALEQQMAFSAVTGVNRDDLAMLQGLQTAFAQELATVQPRLDRLETRLAPIAQHPFSTTTQLTGEVLFTLIQIGEGSRAEAGDGSTDSNLVLGNRVRLTLDTSFTGKDRLRTRLQSGSIPGIDEATGTEMARLTFQEDDSQNRLELSRLEYRFPVGQRATIYVEAVGGSLRDFADPLNPVAGSGRGAISRFGQRNPIYRQGSGSGIGLSYEFNEKLSLGLGFLADDAEEPETGLGGGAYGAIAQLTVEPTENLDFGFSYVRSYNTLDTGTGSRRANDPFNETSAAIATDSFGLQSQIRINPKFTLGGWVDFSRARAIDLPGNPQATIGNWAVTLAFPDLGRKGGLGGIVIGQPPKLLSNDFQLAGQDYDDPGTSLHLEAFYRLPINEQIAVTFGVLTITHPEHNDNNNALYVGTVRTIFSF